MAVFVVAGRPAFAAVNCETAIESADLLTCAQSDLQAAEKRISALERKTLGSLRPNGHGVFSKAQETWKAWRDAECAWNAYDIDSGSTDPLILATCRADMTMTRTDELESALEIIH
jgi:uncharacterized protein YecT (DUF1311 family)